MALGLLGRKMGMTQVNDGMDRVTVTLIRTGPCVVLQKKTQEKDGYTALQIGFGERKAKNTSKAQNKRFEKIKVSPKQHICEYRVEAKELDEFKEGQEVKLTEVFQEGQMIDVAGTSKGRGFAGVFKRWGMAGQSRTHGSHEMFRHGGSIGMGTWPGYVRKNTKMPGHHGDANITVQNLKIVKILEDENCLLVSGSVPGAKNGLLSVVPSKRYPMDRPKKAEPAKEEASSEV